MSITGMSSSRKRLLLNLLLLLMVVILVMFVLNHPQKGRELPQTLFDPAMGDDVTQLVIHVDGRKDIHITNTGKEGARVWRITQPLQQEADKDKVRQLFTLLTEPVSSRYDASGKDLSTFGLDNEKLSISFNGVKLVLGKINPVSQARYVLKRNKIYLVSEAVSGLLESGVDEFKKGSSQ